MPNILLGLSGSVAAIKAWELYELLSELGEVQVVATPSARRFLSVARPPPSQSRGDHALSDDASCAHSIASTPGQDERERGVENPASRANQHQHQHEDSTSSSSAPTPLPLPFPVLGDEDEWKAWQKVGDKVLHIELRRWADLLVISPCSANTLAKISNGLCDNLLTCIVRAWDLQHAPDSSPYLPSPNLPSPNLPPLLAYPLLVAPAMNTLMWSSPFTSRHLTTLTALGATIIDPVSKRLACGDIGLGAMAEPGDIKMAVEEVLRRCGKLKR